MKKFLVFAFAAAMTLAACGDDDSNPTSGESNPATDNGGKKDDGKLDAGCNFAKEDNVWKYKYGNTSTNIPGLTRRRSITRHI